MPIYDFICFKCSHTKEALVKMGTQKIRCPECHYPMHRTIGDKPPAAVNRANVRIPLSGSSFRKKII